jgi:threonine dehydratase
MSPIIVDDIVKHILTSKVYDVALETPLTHASRLSSEKGCSVYLKREDLQPVHSFKIRGAYNKMAHLSEDERKKGVIAASAGNHAQGVALAAKKLGLDALIIMPTTTPSIKVEAVASYGAKIELYGDNYSETYDYCEVRVKETGRTFIHPFDDILVIAGQGTIGKEIMEQLSEVTHIFVSVGGGGLISGIASYVKALKPSVKIISVEPKDSSALATSMAVGKRVELPHVGLFADGVAVKQMGILTYSFATNYVDDFITVNTDQICYAMKAVFEETRNILEPAGALAVAGLQQYNLDKNAHAVAICSGANITFEKLQQVAERALIGSGKEALFSVHMPEEPGAMHAFTTKVVKDRAITEFAYRLRRRSLAHVMVGVTVSGEKDKLKLIDKIRKEGFECSDFTDSDIAKEHIRHMVGGEAIEAENEVFYQIEFPERPNALGNFLTVLANRWNICLFHYRNTASDTGNVLIGFETDSTLELEEALSEAGFKWTYVSNDAVIKIYLGS